LNPFVFQAHGWSANLDDLDDVNLTSLIASDMLIWWPVPGEWRNETRANLIAAFAAATNIEQLLNVTCDTPAELDLLVFNNATGKWECNTLVANQIPALDASKITTGIFNPARVGPTIQDADANTKIQTEESANEDKIRMDVAGVEAFLLEDDGILTLAKQSAARGYKATDQSIPDSTWTIFQIDNTSFDIQGEIDTTNHRFVAKKAGIYLGAGGMQFVTAEVVADKMYGLGITLNGNFKVNSYVHSSHADYIAATCTEVFQMAANDWLDLRIYQSSGAAKNVKGGEEFSHLSVVKIA